MNKPSLILRLCLLSLAFSPLSVMAQDPNTPPSAAELLAAEGEPQFDGTPLTTQSAVHGAITDFIQNPVHASGPHSLTLDNPAAPDVLRILRLGNRIVLEFEVYETVVPEVEQISYNYDGRSTQPQWVTGDRTDALGETRAQQLRTLLDSANIEYQDLWFVNYGRLDGWSNELRAYYHAIHARLFADNPTTIGTIINIANNILEFDYTQTTQAYLNTPEE